MRIAQISPLIEAVPPKLYGGTERVVSYLTDELVAMGNEVTLFASGDSVTTAKLEPSWPKALRLDPTIQDLIAPHVVMFEKIALRARDFDIIHQHCDYLGYPILRRTGVPFLTTLHLAMDRPELPGIYETFPEVALVSVSNAQREPLPQANYVETIYHGMPERMLSPGSGAGGYLAFLGRIAPTKGVDRAIRIAGKAGMQLKIAAKVDRVDREYFRTTIEPMLSQPVVEYIGEIGDAARPISRRCSRSHLRNSVARAVWLGNDRGDGLRHAGYRNAPRLSPGGRGRRRHRLYRRRRGHRSARRKAVDYA